MMLDKMVNYNLSVSTPSYYEYGRDGRLVWVDGHVPTAYGFVLVHHERVDPTRGWHYTRFSFIWDGRVHYGEVRPNEPLTDRQLTLRARKFVKEIVHP